MLRVPLVVSPQVLAPSVLLLVLGPIPPIAALLGLRLLLMVPGASSAPQAPGSIRLEDLQRPRAFVLFVLLLVLGPMVWC